MAKSEANKKPTSSGKADSPRAANAPARPDKSAGTPPADPKPPEYPVKPEFWDTIADSLPPWGDEIAAILLIVFGIVSLLSLLNVSSDATISNAWSNALTSAFGYGAAVVCVGIFLLGIIVLLPKLNIVIRFPTRRILAIEIAFLSLLALLHLSLDDSELRAVARAGRGGGQVGWALSSVVRESLGEPVAIALYGLLLVVSIAIVTGLTRGQLSRWINGAKNGLLAFAARYRRPPETKSASPPASPLDEALKAPLPVTVTTDALGAPSLQKPASIQAQRVRAHSIMRIRPNAENIPPSLRAAPPPAPPAPPSPQPALEMVTPVLPPDARPPIPINTRSTAEHPLFQKREANNLSAIGTLKGKPTKGGGPIPVERPDGRVKKYFSVAGMKEPKYVGKRDTNLPPLDMLRDVELNLPDETEINLNVVLIENTLLEFDIDVDVVDVKVGPTVTQYAVQPFKEVASEGGELTRANMTRISKIASLANDLALSLSARRLRMEAPVPGHSYVGIEVPNKNPSVVALRSVYESRSFYEALQKKKSPLFIPLGRDVSGAPVGIDLATMPHMLIAGTTGSGKSVCIAAIAAALIMENTPDNVKLVMLDPKMVELSRFNGIPHLLGPVEVDQERIIGVLRWCTREMDRRYKVLEEAAARNIDTYNSRLGRRRRDDYLPYIVIMIDEIGDLMMNHPDETEKTVTRLAQMARAVGMHLIVATQRPSVDVITGLIKANFPSRISFQVASSTDSRVILDAVGAETLMGRGDMLYYPADATAPRRLQGCFVSDDEVRAITAYWRDWHKAQVEDGKLEPTRVAPWERGLTRREFLSETDPLLEQAIALVVAEREASASLIQRRLGVGYPRAARIMDLLEELGVIGRQKAGGRGREVLIRPGRDPFKDIIDKKMGKGG